MQLLPTTAAIAFSITLALPSRADEPEPPPTAAFDLPEAEAEAAEPVAPEAQLPPPTVPAPHWVPLYTAPSSARVEEPTTERRWYGWQTLLVDALSIGLMVKGVDSDGYVALAGLVGYGFAAPIVHVAHGHAGKGLASLGLRAGGPVAGAMMGAAIADCPDRSSDNDGDDYCGFGEVVIGLLLGAGAAIAVDAAVIAREDVEPSRTRPVERGVRVVPNVSVTRDRATFSLGGTF